MHYVRSLVSTALLLRLFYQIPCGGSGSLRCRPSFTQIKANEEEESDVNEDELPPSVGGDDIDKETFVESPLFANALTVRHRVSSYGQDHSFRSPPRCVRYIMCLVSASKAPYRQCRSRFSMRWPLRYPLGRHAFNLRLMSIHLRHSSEALFTSRADTHRVHSNAMSATFSSTKPNAVLSFSRNASRKACKPTLRRTRVVSKAFITGTHGLRSKAASLHAQHPRSRSSLTVQCAKVRAFFLSVSASRQDQQVAVLGAAGGIGQPLALLLKMNKLVTDLALYDIANMPGVAADLSHCNTPVNVPIHLARASWQR